MGVTKFATRFARDTNNAGGLEGGISNGEDVVVRGYLKPISTSAAAAGKSVELCDAGAGEGRV